MTARECLHVTSIVGCTSAVFYQGGRGHYNYVPMDYREPALRLECGCGARAWQREKPYPTCAYCGREPYPVAS